MKDDRLYLIEIDERIRRIESFTQAGRDKFMNSFELQDATIRNFEVIGEAAKRVSPALKDAHPEIPWKRISGFRDVLIHDYLGVNAAEVWNIVEHDLPDLKSKIKSLLAISPTV